jgi:hypothetical protein
VNFRYKCTGRYKQSISLYLSCSCILFYSICQRVGTPVLCFWGGFFVVLWCAYVNVQLDLLITYGFTCAAASTGLVVSVLSSDVTGDTGLVVSVLSSDVTGDKYS